MAEAGTEGGVTVRPATEADLEAIRAIYNAEVLGSTATFDEEPRDAEAQRRWLEAHQHPYAALVAEADGAVLGWGALSPFGARAAYRFTAEDSVYVHADARGRGVGTVLLRELLRAGRERGFRTVVARITAENGASIRLHERCGFVVVGVEREVGYKFGRWLDVVVMQRRLGE